MFVALHFYRKLWGNAQLEQIPIQNVGCSSKLMENDFRLDDILLNNRCRKTKIVFSLVSQLRVHLITYFKTKFVHLFSS